MIRLIGLLVLLMSTPLMAVDGKGLHDRACLQCHSSLTGGKPNTMYTRGDHKVKTLVKLRKRVKGCAVAADVSWTKQQREMVVQYLAMTFYHF